MLLYWLHFVSLPLFPFCYQGLYFNLNEFVTYSPLALSLLAALLSTLILGLKSDEKWTLNSIRLQKEKATLSWLLALVLFRRRRWGDCSDRHDGACFLHLYGWCIRLVMRDRRKTAREAYRYSSLTAKRQALRSSCLISDFTLRLLPLCAPVCVCESSISVFRYTTYFIFTTISLSKYFGRKHCGSYTLQYNGK